MRFLLDREQREFARTLDALLGAAGTPAAVRAWASGDPGPGRALWKRLADVGLFALAVPERHGGAGLHPVELAVTFQELGRHAVPGPLVETVAAATLLAGVDGVADGAVRGAVLAGPGRAGAAVEPGRGGSGAAPEGDASTAGPGRAPAPVEPGRGAAAVEPGPPASAPGGSGSGALPPGGPAHGGPARTDAAPETARPGDAAPESVPSGGLAEGLLSRIAAGDALVSLCLLSPAQPYALDADAADVVLVVEGEVLRRAEPVGPVRRSADPARRLVRPGPGPVLARGPGVAAAAARAYDMAALATAAQALGLGRALLDATVRYVRERTQFGVPVGSFQAVKHRLADTLLGLEFAEPLVYGAALALARGEADGRAVSAAKVAAGEAAYAAARTALHLHGALGYTEEPDLSLWIRKARPLRDAWGTPAAHRARVLAP